MGKDNKLGHGIINNRYMVRVPDKVMEKFEFKKNDILFFCKDEKTGNLIIKKMEES